jgi:hypothetical protein
MKSEALFFFFLQHIYRLQERVITLELCEEGTKRGVVNASGIHMAGEVPDEGHHLGNVFIKLATRVVREAFCMTKS